MKKKSWQYKDFITSSNSVNYRDNRVIFERFNSSIRLFKKFQDYLHAGDETLASEKLRDSGTYLYQCCEWALKNYLDKRYNEQFTDKEVNKLEKQKLLEELSKKTCNLNFLLKEFKRVSKPPYSHVGINCEDILHNAFKINNSPKHYATIPDPNKYKISLGEIRKIIKTYIDENATLDLIEDTIYGHESGWYEVLEDTNDFSDMFSYVLVTGNVDNPNVKGLFSIKWDLIIDMDPKTDINGLMYLYKSYTGVNPWIRTLNNIDSKRKFTYSNLPCWIMANGYIDDPDTIVEAIKWKSRYGRFLDNLLENFHSSYSKPVKVFIYPFEGEKNIEKIVDSFNAIYEDGKKADFCVLSPDQEYSRIDCENFKKSTLKFEEFCNNLMISYENENFIIGFYEKKIPASTGDFIPIEPAFASELKDSFELVYIDIDKEEENDSTKTNRLDFYKGNIPISWYGLRENFDVVRKEVSRIVDKISFDMHERGRLLKRICYEPGIGGTTIMRRLAWELREKYPTLIITQINEQTTRNIQKIYDITRLPIMLFADSNVIEFDEIQHLQMELKRMGFAFIICYLERKSKGIVPSEGAIYALIKNLNESETREMSSLLKDFCADEIAKENLNKICISNRNNEERSPFIMSMYTFDKDFKGVKPYISNFLNKMNEQTKKILFAVSLADFGNISIDMQYFMDTYDEDTINDFFVKEILGISELVKLEKINGKEYLKIKYHLFAKEVLCQMSNGRDSEEIIFTALIDDILSFIEDSRKNIYVINKDTLNLLRNLFVTRVADSDSEKPTFSPLISKLKEENKAYLLDKYDTSNDAIVRIFNKLVETYPEEPHFTAHLARYYFYIEQNYKIGFSNIDKAIELSETMNGIVDPLLYHMKAMGYSSRITNTYIKNIYKNYKEENYDDNIAIIESIKEDSQEAFRYFEMVRDRNVGIAGHVSEINLCIHISSMTKNYLDESKKFIEYVTTEKGNWIIEYIDRANNLFDECKKIAAENNIDNLDDIEVNLRNLLVNVEDSIDIWKDYLKIADGKNKIRARRMLARAYEKRSENAHNSQEEQENIKNIIKLMEENISEESRQSGNIRIWFEAIKKLKTENKDAVIMDAIIKLNRWIAITNSVEAHYYRFVLKFIQAIQGSTLSETELPKLLRELKNLSISLYNRTTTMHWLTKNGDGIDALMPNSRSKKNVITEEQMAQNMRVLHGRISTNYVNESHAYINFRGIEIYFNPSATKGEIDKSKINQRVRFGVGFSYDGPRAYNSSIKLMEPDDYIPSNRELSSGIQIKCEVIKNVSYYVQVKIIGYDEFGSIHIDELINPYSERMRPTAGTILDCKILNRKFDNKKQRDMWVLTMNLFTIYQDDDNETELGRKLREALQSNNSHK